MKTFLTGALLRVFIFIALIIATSTAHATEIVLVNNDGPNEGFNDNSPGFANQTGNSGGTLGEQRLNVFQAAADYWEERLVSSVTIRVGINFDPLFCSTFSATLGSAGPSRIFRNFPNAPQSNTWYVAAVADSLSGSDRSPGITDIAARFNSSIDNNPNCLGNNNWWLGINSPAPSGTISLFDTVLHEIGHGLGVISLVNQAGQLNAGRNDAFSLNLYDETIDKFWSNMTDSERATSSINTGNLVWRGVNADNNSDHITSGKTNGHLRMYAPNPYRGGSSVSHWDTALSPDELMEPSATPTSNDLATIQLLKDVGWQIVEGPGDPGTVGFRSIDVSVFEDQGPATLEIERTGGTDGAVSVRLDSSNITATGGGIDYNSIINQTISWADGESGIKTIQVTVIDDGIAEAGGETASFTLSNATGGVSIGQGSATLTINDPIIVTNPGTVGFRVANSSVVEDSGPALVELERTGGTDGAVSVLVSSSGGTATSGGVDYNSIVNQQVSWADSESGIKAVAVTVIDDALAEAGGETVIFSLNGATGGVGLGRNSTTLTINDPPIVGNPGTLGFLAASYNVDEGNIAVLQVTRTGGTTGAVSILVNSSNITATGGGIDYTSIVNRRLDWADGESGIKTVNVQTITDTENEPAGETALFSLSGATGGAGIGRSTTTLTIEENPSEPPETDDGDDLLFLIPTIISTIKK